MSGLEGPDVRADGVGLVALGFGSVRIFGLEARFLGRGRMSRLAARCPGPVDLAAGPLLQVSPPGPDVWGHGRMSGSWELCLTPSVGYLHP